jgi:hypothetical protein
VSPCADTGARTPIGVSGNSSSPITSLTPFTPPERIHESPKTEISSIPCLPLIYENVQTHSNDLGSQTKNKICIDEASATVGRTSVIVNRPSATATVDTQCCGTATSVIKMARTESERELTKEENIPVYNDFEMEVVHISQEDEIYLLKEKNVVIANPPINFKKVYLHNNENANGD